MSVFASAKSLNSVEWVHMKILLEISDMNLFSQLQKRPSISSPFKKENQSNFLQN